MWGIALPRTPPLELPSGPYPIASQLSWLVMSPVNHEAHERFKKKVLKRPGSPAGLESSEPAQTVQAPSPAEPSQPHMNQKYGLLQLKPNGSRPQPPEAEQYPIDTLNFLPNSYIFTFMLRPSQQGPRIAGPVCP
jgi:hypothetical protein